MVAVALFFLTLTLLAVTVEQLSKKPVEPAPPVPSPTGPRSVYSTFGRILVAHRHGYRISIIDGPGMYPETQRVCVTRPDNSFVFLTLEVGTPLDVGMDWAEGLIDKETEYGTR